MVLPLTRMLLRLFQYYFELIFSILALHEDTLQDKKLRRPKKTKQNKKTITITSVKLLNRVLCYNMPLLEICENLEKFSLLHEQNKLKVFTLDTSFSCIHL